jgi:hypothetical protein
MEKMTGARREHPDRGRRRLRQEVRRERAGRAKDAGRRRRRHDLRHRPEIRQELADIIMKAGTIVWNGPVGVFEFDQFGGGTKTVAMAIANDPASAWPAAATPSPRSRSTTSTTRCPTSPPPAAPSWNTWKARPCRRWPCSKKGASKSEPRLSSALGWPTSGEKGRCYRRTKIVATLGPATDDPKPCWTRSSRAGVDVVRLNCRTAATRHHARRADWVRTGPAPAAARSLS